MNKFFLILGTLLVLTLGALFGAPYFIDWSNYRGIMEEQATRIIGRKVRVGDQVGLRLLPVPKLRFRRVRIADQNNSFARPFVTADSFDMRLSIGSLLAGTFEATEIVLTKPVLALAVDERGRGNWTGFDLRNADKSILPSSVALPAVRIVDGTLRLASRSSGETFKVNQVSGVFSAPSLKGPFKFRGTQLFTPPKGKAIKRRIRISTGVLGAKGKDTLPVSMQLRVPELDGKFVFEGDLKSLHDTERGPQLEGQLAALFGEDGKVSVSEDNKAVPTRDGFGVRGKLSGTTSGIRVSDLAMSFETAGRPQSVAGEIAVSWLRKVAVVGDLNARWLDLNRFAAKSTLSVQARLQRIAAHLVSWTPARGSLRLTGRVEQGTLKDGSVNNVVVDFENSSDGLAIKSLSAELPGAGRLHVDGQITSEADATARFSGNVRLRGGSLKRFAKWVSPKTDVSRLNSDGFFLLAGKLDLKDQVVALSDMTGEFADARFSGRVRYQSEEDASVGQLDLDLKSGRIDLATFGGDVPDLAGIVSAAQLKVADIPADAPNAQHLLGWVKAQKRVSTRLEFGRVVSGKTVLRDFVFDAELKDDTLAIGSFRATSNSAAKVRLDGTVAKLSGTPSGRLNLLIAARDAGDAKLVFDSVERVLGTLPLNVELRDAIGKGMVPFRLAGVVELEGDDTNAAGKTRTGKGVSDTSALSTSLVLDGNAGAAHIRVSGEFDAASDGGDTRIDIELKDDDGSRLFKRLRDAVVSEPSAVVAVTPDGGPNAGRLSLRLRRNGARPTKLTAQLTTRPLSAIFNGRLKVAASGAAKAPSSLIGNFQFSGPSIRSVAGSKYFAIREPADTVDGLDGGEDMPFNVAGRVSGVSDRLEFSELRGKLGETTFVGALTSTPDVKVAGQRFISGRVQLSQLDMAAMLATLTLSKQNEAREPATSFWTDTPFKIRTPDHLKIGLDFEAADVALQDGLTASRVRGRLELAPSSVQLSRVTGRALGGRFSGALSLTSGVAGAVVAAKLSAQDVALREVAQFAPDVSAATGRASLTFEFGGQGLSPRGLAAVARGKGTLQLQSARLERLSPAVVQTAALAELSRGRRFSLDRLKRGLTGALGVEGLEISNRRVPVTIQNGGLKFEPVKVAAVEADLTIEASLDLDGMTVNSLVEVTPKPADADERPLPAVTIALNGPLSNLGALEPRFLFDNLARELTVRKLEQDVQDLEKLREREQQIAEEIERRRVEAEARRLKEAEEEAARERLRRAAEQKLLENGQNGQAPLFGPRVGLEPPKADAEEKDQKPAATSSGLQSSGAANSADGATRASGVAGAAPVVPRLDGFDLRPLPTQPELAAPAAGAGALPNRASLKVDENGIPIGLNQLTADEKAAAARQRQRAARRQRLRVQRRRARQRENSFDPFDVN